MYEDSINTDKAAVISVLAGNTDAYSDIVHKYKEIVFRAVYAMIKNHHTAEDIAQDTFVDGFIKLKSLGEPYNVGAWLVTIAKNKCRNYLTRSALRHESELNDFIPDTETPTPEDIFIAKQEKDAVEQAVQRLPELHKSVTVLYYFNNLSQNKIAELLNIPVGTVKRRLYDARLKLKKELEAMNENELVSKDFEEKVREKVRAVQAYHHVHSLSGFQKDFSEAVELIEKLPESKAKHDSYTDIYRAAVDNSSISNTDRKEYLEKGLREAELSGNAEAMAYMARYISYGSSQNHTENIIKIKELIQKVKNMPESENALGELYYYLGSEEYHAAVNMEQAIADLKEARKHMKKSNYYHANAEANIKMIEIEESEKNKSYGNPVSLGSEKIFVKDGKTAGHINNLGKHLFLFSEASPDDEPSNLFEFAANQFDTDFLKDEANIGIETEMKTAYNKTVTLISNNEKVKVLGGEFDNCIHVQFKGSVQSSSNPPVNTVEPEILPYVINAYYAKNTGIIRLCFSFDGKSGRNYELHEYKINSDENVGLEYLPLSEGNMWKYTDTNLSPVYWKCLIREVVGIYTDDIDYTVAMVSKTDFLSLRKVNKFDDECDSETYIRLAREQLFDVMRKKTDKLDFDSTIKYLNYAVQRNSSARASLFALHACEYIKKYNETKDKQHWFPHAFIQGKVLRKNKEKDTLAFDEEFLYYHMIPSPERDWTLHGSEKKFLGAKPFRSLQKLAGTLFSEKWVSGYSEQKNLEESSPYTSYEGGIRIKNREMENCWNLKVEDGGTVKVKAGTFENCLKVTFDLKWDNLDTYRYYLKTNFALIADYGTKIFWYAPNVGIVKHECIWDESLSSACELSEYKSSATDGEYMPVYLGNYWVYEETTIEPIYTARVKYNIASGMENEFFMIDEEEFVYKDTITYQADASAET